MNSESNVYIEPASGPVARPEADLAIYSTSAPLAAVPEKTQGALLRMFGDPHLLEKEERASLANDLRQCVAANPEVSELRVVLGMALCVNFEVEDAIEELREAVRLSPDSYIAQLKMGELWMRLRVMPKAEEHTHLAGKLASNMAQVEMARRQAASIRTIKHAGIERGGYKSAWTIVTRIGRRLWRREPTEIATALDVS